MDDATHASWYWNKATWQHDGGKMLSLGVKQTQIQLTAFFCDLR